MSEIVAETPPPISQSEYDAGYSSTPSSNSSEEERWMEALLKMKQQARLLKKKRRARLMKKKLEIRPLEMRPLNDDLIKMKEELKKIKEELRKARMRESSDSSESSSTRRRRMKDEKKHKDSSESPSTRRRRMKNEKKHKEKENKSNKMWKKVERIGTMLDISRSLVSIGNTVKDFIVGGGCTN